MDRVAGDVEVTRVAKGLVRCGVVAGWKGSVRTVAGVAINKFLAESVVGEVYVVDEGRDGDVGVVVDVGGNGVEWGSGNTGSLW